MMHTIAEMLRAAARRSGPPRGRRGRVHYAEPEQAGVAADQGDLRRWVTRRSGAMAEEVDPVDSMAATGEPAPQ